MYVRNFLLSFPLARAFAGICCMSRPTIECCGGIPAAAQEEATAMLRVIYMQGGGNRMHNTLLNS